MHIAFRTNLANAKVRVLVGYQIVYTIDKVIVEHNGGDVTVE